MKLKLLKRKRHIVYNEDLTGDNPGKLVFDGDNYQAYKLRIQRRDTDDGCGEMDFLIRDKSNNLRFTIVYCFLDDSGTVFSIAFWINNKVLLPSGELVTAEVLVDEEKANYFVMDLVENYLKKNYSFLSDNLQQL